MPAIPPQLPEIPAQLPEIPADLPEIPGSVSRLSGRASLISGRHSRKFRPPIRRIGNCCPTRRCEQVNTERANSRELIEAVVRLLQRREVGLSSDVL